MGVRSVAWVSVLLLACGESGSSKTDGNRGDGGTSNASSGGAGRGGSSGGATSSGGAGTAGGGGDHTGGAPPAGGGQGGNAGDGEGGNAGAGEGGSSGAGEGGSSGGVGEGGNPPDWDDVVPVRTRVGPRTLPREVFISQLQLGAFWETPSGDVLTSFRTSITQPVPGVAIDDFHYKLRTIVGDTIEPVPDLDVGVCRYQDRPYGSCSVGPDPAGPSGRSLVTENGTILVVKEQPATLDRMHPLVERLDPKTGTFSTVAEMPDIDMGATSLAYTATLALRQLADGTIALATAMQGDPARTIVFNTAGERLAQRAGFAFGERWQRFALFVGETSGPYNQRFDWWDPRTGASARAFGFPAVTPAPSFRTFVTPVGDVLFPGFTHTDRLVHIDQDGAIVEDRVQPAWNFLAVLPDGRYLATERDPTLGYVLRVYDRRGVSTVLYDQATLMQESGWPPLSTGVAGTFPAISPLNFQALVDDAGNAFVGFVLETNGNTTSRTYLVAFAPNGQKLWGLNLAGTTYGTCHAEAVLSRYRLVVRCDERYVRRFIILAE